MYRIVMGVDENEDRARACAEAVTDLPGDPEDKEVWLLHSFTDNPAGASAPQVHSVRVAEELLGEAGIEAEISEYSGDPAKALLDEAANVDADVIVVAGRRRSPAGKALFGSTTQAVILDADRPVLVTSVG